MKTLSLTARLNIAFTIILVVTLALAYVSWHTVPTLSGELTLATKVTALKAPSPRTSPTVRARCGERFEV